MTIPFHRCLTCNAPLEVVDKEAISAELTDTLQVGPFHILAARARVPLARAAAEMALESSPQSIRDTAAVALRNVVVMVRKAHFLANAGKEVVGQSLSALTTKEDLAQAFRQVLARQLNAGLDEAVRNWMGGAMPIGAATHEALAPFYIDLATRPSRPARACLRGDANGCAMAIRLVTPKLF